MWHISNKYIIWRATLKKYHGAGFVCLSLAEGGEGFFSSSWVHLRLHATNLLYYMPGSGSGSGSMWVGGLCCWKGFYWSTLAIAKPC